VMPGETVVPNTIVREIGSRDLERVRTLWRQLQDALVRRDWTRYGELMEEIDRALEQR